MNLHIGETVYWQVLWGGTIYQHYLDIDGSLLRAKRSSRGEMVFFEFSKRYFVLGFPYRKITCRK